MQRNYGRAKRLSFIRAAICHNRHGNLRQFAGAKCRTKNTAVVNLLKLGLGTLIALQQYEETKEAALQNAPIISCPLHPIVR
jgi:hypothetical protein